ncbi:GNAT family N-acetyltransferase [Pedobacter ginsengiterrae]|uniref:GNAT family N-acetyltransferase n=1 Tax=Pedobacter ginsengiterrae TaxID=871696 RepID=A0ABP7NSA8_9SPHI
MEIQIDSISNESSKAIIDIILPIQQKEFNVQITLEDQPDLLDIENFYHLKGGGFWGAKINGELVGTIALIKFDNDSAAIRKMFVKKEFRGKELGIAQKLLEKLIDYSNKSNIKNLYLGTVTVLQAALRFYEKNGFIHIAKENLPSKFPFMNADNVFCELTLKK